MRIVADANILIRAVVHDDQRQAQIAAELLRDAELVAVSLVCLCEFVWVLRSAYKLGRGDIVAAIRTLLAADNIVANGPAVEAGLAVLEAGGDFADGVIAFEGNWLGGEVFVSFDRQAVALVAAQGHRARLADAPAG